MKPPFKKRDVGRELDAFAPDYALNEETPPENAEAYRYSCPVDHTGHMVNLRGWRVKDSADRSAFILIHDVGENIRMYRGSAYYICTKGISCYGFDQRGHGESTDSIGRIVSFDDLVHDLLQVVAWVRHLHKGKPPILVGQGYGCLIASEMIAKYPELASGIILSAPTVELSKDLSPLRRFIIKWTAEIAPTLHLPKFLRPRFSNPQHRVFPHTMATRIVKGLISANDLKVTGGFAWELISAMERFPEVLSSIKNPTLILLPEADEVAKFERVAHAIAAHPERQFFECISIAGLHHNSFTESDASMKTVTNTIVEWTDKHNLREHNPQEPIP